MPASFEARPRRWRVLRRLREPAVFCAILCAIGSSASACREGKPLPVEATDTAAGATTGAGRPSAADPTPGAATGIDASAPDPAWASWPMPNSSPGLPNPQSYNTSTAGVVVDRVTGLMWQRNLANEFLTFGDAQQRCARLMLAGHVDWRLPSRIELVSILDVTRLQPSINEAVFPGTPSDWFWTSSVSSENPHAAWYVYFYFGYPKTDDMTNQFSVRCVRQTASLVAPPARYDIQADAVLDVATGLTWQRRVPAGSFAFDAARGYCSQLSLGGKKGWRAPSLAELLTLIDERAPAPMIDSGVFPGTPAESFWTSSTFANGPEMAWHVYFDHGNALYGLVAAPNRVRCVL